MYVRKIGYVEACEDSVLQKNTDRTAPNLSGYMFYQIRTHADEAVTDACTPHNGAIYPAADAEIGVNMPPFHYGCRCVVVGISTDNPNHDPWMAEQNLWLEIMYGDLPLSQQVQLLKDFYRLKNVEPHIIASILWVMREVSNIRTRMEEFHAWLRTSADPISNPNADPWRAEQLARIVEGYQIDRDSGYFDNRFQRGQCTWFAFARVQEIAGIAPQFRDSGGLDARHWASEGFIQNGVIVDVPMIGTIIVWGGGDGHVAVVERIVGDRVYFSEANWDGDIHRENPESDGTIRVRTLEQLRADGNFEGFVMLS